MLREIVTIDEELCNGCGLCVPACQEGAFQIVNGKARLVADRLCDGLGACLGHCPRGALKIVRRPAAPFEDPHSPADRPVADQARRGPAPMTCPSVHPRGLPQEVSQQAVGCPGSRLTQFAREPGVSGTASAADPGLGPGRPSALSHWPIQLRLLPLETPVPRKASRRLAADCLPVAGPGFHARLLRRRL